MGTTIGLLSDIHANARALWSALETLNALGVDDVFCLGDIVGYGPEPAACVDIVRSLGIQAVQGNHDAAAAGMVPLDTFHASIRSDVERTRGQLSGQARRFLGELPQRYSFPWGELVHASPLDPLWHDVDGIVAAYEVLRTQPGAVYFVGHTHKPGAFVGQNRRIVRIEARTVAPNVQDTGDPQQGTLMLQPARGLRYIVNPGSVGQPRDGDPRPSLARVELEGSRAVSVTWYRCEHSVRGGSRSSPRARAPSRGPVPVALTER